ncbi:MAG: hypothetical protein RBT11_07560 [Desulfobacterales bacterium]|nr:hypothetical protein [Desulfobacterales bacterium]
MIIKQSLCGPGENRKTIEQSLAFADSLDLKTIKITMGIRRYPNTDLACTTIKEGDITPNDSLLIPKGSMAPGQDEWLRSTVSAWQDERPNWIL